MTERQKKIESVTDSIYYYMIEIISQANDLEDLGLSREGEELRSIADRIERLGIRLMNRNKPRSRA